MKRLLFLLAIAALVPPGTALSKGPVEAMITGPGLDKAIVLSGVGEEPTPAGSLAESAGFFLAAFTPGESPLLQARPRGDLGPRYTITYKLPDEIKQYAYPYATPPVAYMPPDQGLFGADVTRGGWFLAGPQLKTLLVSAGLPKSAPGGSGSDPSGSFSLGLLRLFGAGLLLVMATTLVMRRRARPATTA